MLKKNCKLKKFLFYKIGNSKLIKSKASYFSLLNEFTYPLAATIVMPKARALYESFRALHEIIFKYRNQFIPCQNDPKRCSRLLILLKIFLQVFLCGLVKKKKSPSIQTSPPMGV